MLLLDVHPDCTNMVISRHKNPLYACSIPIGTGQLTDEASVGRLVMELNANRRQFTSLYKNAQIERLIFLSGLAVEPDIYRMIAKQLEVQAQLGDCMAAVEMADPNRIGLERRNGKVSWALAFGLSLS